MKFDDIISKSTKEYLDTDKVSDWQKAAMIFENYQERFSKKEVYDALLDIADITNDEILSNQIISIIDKEKKIVDKFINDSDGYIYVFGFRYIKQLDEWSNIFEDYEEAVCCNFEVAMKIAKNSLVDKDLNESPRFYIDKIKIIKDPNEFKDNSQSDYKFRLTFDSKTMEIIDIEDNGEYDSDINGNKWFFNRGYSLPYPYLPGTVLKPMYDPLHNDHLLYFVSNPYDEKEEKKFLIADYYDYYDVGPFLYIINTDNRTIVNDDSPYNIFYYDVVKRVESVDPDITIKLLEFLEKIKTYPEAFMEMKY